MALICILMRWIYKMNARECEPVFNRRTLTSPAAGTAQTALANVMLTTNAVAASGRTLTQVAFYQNGQLFGTDITAPYTYDWTTIPAGSAATASLAQITAEQ